MKRKSLIPRSSLEHRKVTRLKPTEHFREEDEVKAAYDQIGDTPYRGTKSWYRDIYDYYQNNEC